MAKHIIVEGPDCCGKSYLIRTILAQEKFKDYEVEHLSGVCPNTKEFHEYLLNYDRERKGKSLLALNQLMNIASYYNGKQYMRVGHYIGYDKLEDRYFVNNSDNAFTQKAGIAALFIFAKDAQAVIDNPNFRRILDTRCK